MRWFSPTTDGEKVGFDNFKVSALEIFESWATQADLDPSTGAGYLMWTGGIASFELTTESWPTSFDHDRARLLRSPPPEAFRHCSLPTAPRSPTLKLVPVNGYRLHVIDPSGSQADGVYRDDVGVARPRRKSFRFLTTFACPAAGPPARSSAFAKRLCGAGPHRPLSIIARYGHSIAARDKAL